MKLLGIDYGTKRIGIAISDENEEFAFPRLVLENNSAVLSTLMKLCKEEEVGAVVMGESRDYKGVPNPVMKKISAFKLILEKELGVPVYLEPEYLTSHEAEHIQGKTDMHDASAASLILKSYLEKKKNKKN